MPRRRTNLLLLMTAALAVLVGCEAQLQTDEAEPIPKITTETEPVLTSEPVEEPGEVVYLTPAEHLTRISIALRGKRPTLDELRDVTRNPDRIEQYVDEYMQTDEFGKMIRDMHDEDLLVRSLTASLAPIDEFADRDIVGFNASLHEQPLRLVEHVVTEDRPYSEIVTADYTVADGIVAGIWGLDYQGDGEEWVQTRWPEEGREHAGLLTESMIYMRHPTTPLNAQRSRANMFSRALLCYDFLDRSVRVEGNVDLSNPQAVNNAVQDDPSCASCHQALDPLANLFWKFEYYVDPEDVQEYPFSNYRPQYDERHRPVLTNRPKGYFGLEATTLEQLGQQIADDPRFSLCATRRFYGYLTQTPRDEVEMGTVAELHADFVESGLDARTLVKEIVLSDAFRSSHATGEAVADDAIGVLKLRPRQITSYAEDLTGGFRWQMSLPFPLFQDRGVDANYGTVNFAEDSLFGYEVMAGGLDDFVVTRPQHTVNATSVLVYERLAFEMAGWVVEADLGEVDITNPRRRSLLTRVTADTTDEETLREQLVDLHLRVLTVDVDADAAPIDETLELWNAAYDLSGDTRRAWKTVLSALFRDPRFLLY